MADCFEVLDAPILQHAITTYLLQKTTKVVMCQAQIAKYEEGVSIGLIVTETA